MDDEDTEVGPAPWPDPDRTAVMLADTDEWDDTDHEIEAQGTIDTSPAMFEDTGVMIISKPAEPRQSEHVVVTFRPQPANAQTLRGIGPERQPRATTAEWPPAPREPAATAPQIRERAFRRAGVYSVVSGYDSGSLRSLPAGTLRDETKN